MKLIKKSQTNLVNNSPVVRIEEYLHNDPETNLAIGTITGKYPESGFVVNEISKELAYVLEGEINILIRDSVVHLSTGDSVIIDKNEVFAWDGHAKILTVCLPSWHPAQHKEVA